MPGQQFYEEVMREEEYWEMQAALPPHKRDGYAERMAEYADLERKRQREEGKNDKA